MAKKSLENCTPSTPKPPFPGPKHLVGTSPQPGTGLQNSTRDHPWSLGTRVVLTGPDPKFQPWAAGGVGEHVLLNPEGKVATSMVVEAASF